MKSSTFLFTAAAAVTASFMLAGVARAEEVVQTSRTRPNSAMLTSGAFALGVPYVTSVIVGASSNHPGDKNLFVPVAGPWMDLANRHCEPGATCNNEGLYKGLLITNGIFQGIGALEIAGAFLFETVTVTSAARTSRPRVARVLVAPASVGTGFGLTAAGAF